MKAIRVSQTGEPSVLKWEEVPDLIAGPGQIVVTVKAVGVNPVDTYIRGGKYGPVALPYTPGMDAAGEVSAVGEGVKKVKVGDRVYTAGTFTGSYAEKALCRENQVWPLPPNITFSQGAGLYVPYATAYRALFQKAHAQAGEVILVHGASGGVGIAAVQIGRAAGLKIVGTAGTPEGRELVLREGAHACFDHSESDYLTKAVAETADGKGFDVILEMLANVNLDKDLDSIAKWGRIVVIGNRGRVEIDARKTMGKDSSILGMTLMNAAEEDTASIHSAIFAGLENGSLRPVVRCELPLADAPHAHELVMAPGAFGKIVMIP
jgi:NADPH:quinone reductase